MEKFKKGFCLNDTITNTNERYIRVTNNNKEFIIGDNGERRIWDAKREKCGKLFKGDLSYEQIKK